MFILSCFYPDYLKNNNVFLASMYGLWMLQYLYQSAGRFEVFKELSVAGAGEVSGQGCGEGQFHGAQVLCECGCCVHARDRHSFALNASCPCQKGDVDSIRAQPAQLRGFLWCP